MSITDHSVDCRVIELRGVSYVILRNSDFRRLLKLARGADSLAGEKTSHSESLDGWDQRALARHILSRRKRARLTQKDLALRAGIRVETLNRIERGRTTPDFRTIRKVAAALKKVESRQTV